MANTIIQIKRSTVTNIPTPGSLSAGEPAYSYSSNVMYVGTSDGTGVLPIGGQYYVNVANSAYAIAAAAYNAANAAGSSETVSRIYDQANNAYNKANSANYFAYLVNANTVAAFDKANVATQIASASYDSGNSTLTIASSSYDKANSANLLAFDSGQIATNAFNKANTSSVAAGAGFDKANSAESIAIAAYVNSNTKFSSSGGTITGEVAITGNLVISGNVYSQDTVNLTVQDPLIYLASNNYVSDIVDIGFIANYVNATGSNVHTGLYREHENKEYYLFQGYDQEVMNNHIGAFSNNMTLAVLNADLKTSNLVLGGVNTITWITSSYNQANIGLTAASASYDYANIVGGITSSAYDKANSANLLAYSSGIIASNAYDKANTANINAANASFISTGNLAVAYGGTGVTTLTENGILYGSGTGPVQITSAGTEGQVLQASSTGVPQFAMLDGGNF